MSGQRRAVGRLLAVVAAGVALLLGGASAANAAVFWTNYDSGTIGKYEGYTNQSFITGASAPVAMFATDTHVYWANFGSNTIGRANIDGSGVNQSFITIPPHFYIGRAVDGIAVTATHIYWAENTADYIGRANIDGTGVDPTFITGLGQVTGVVKVSATHIYWADYGSNSIGRANIDGSGVNQNFITGIPGEVEGLAVTGTHIYYGSLTGNASASVGRANLDGSGVNHNFVTGVNSVYGVTVDSNYVYWTEPGVYDYGINQFPGTTIGRAALDGSGINHNFISGADGPMGVAVTGEQQAALPPQAPGAPGAPVVAAGDGQLVVTVSAPGSGGTPTSYTVTVSDSGGVPVGTCTVSGASGSCTVSGLTNGTEYTVTSTATNDVGTSPVSPSTLATPKTGQSITFGQPSDTAFDAGPVVVAPTASSGLDVTVVSGTAGVCTVSGFTVTLASVGTCTLTAQQAGDGTFGAAADVSRSFAVTPGTALTPVLGAATGVVGGFTVQVGNHDPVWTWAVSSTAGTATIDGTGLVTVTGLAPGETADVTVTTSRANYAGGTATTTGVGATAPDAPSNVTAVIVGKTASVAFDPAAANGSEVTQYTVVASEGGGQCVLSAPFTAPLQCSIGGLVRGVTYTFSVTATNAVGVSPVGVSNAVSTADPLPTVGNRPWAVNPGSGLPRRVRSGAAVPLLTEEQVEAGAQLTALTPGVCVVRDSRVFTIGRGVCRVRVAVAGQAGTVVGMRVVRGRPGAAPGESGLRLVARLLFRPDSARLTPVHQRVLGRAAVRLRGREALVTGHAHDAGTGNGDHALSRVRAQNVVDRLRQLGLDQVTLLTHALGSVQNGNKAPVNRRVDIYTM